MLVIFLIPLYYILYSLLFIHVQGKQGVGYYIDPRHRVKMKKPATATSMNTPVTPFTKPHTTSTSPKSSSNHKKSPQQSQSQSIRKRRVSFGKPQAKGNDIH